jgi:signal recognition particle subunit SRP54
MKKGTFDLDDLAEQLQQMRKLGGMSGVLGMLPGVGKIKKQLEGVDLDNLVLKRQLAIIGSMTAFERRSPKVMNASRKKRVARGSGTKVEEINRLLKMHLQMSDMMKKVGRNPGLFGKMFGQGQAAPDAAELEKMQAELSRLDPNALPAELKEMVKGIGEGGAPAMPDLSQGLKGLPGLGGGRQALPGLGGQPFRGFPGPGMKKK